MAEEMKIGEQMERFKIILIELQGLKEERKLHQLSDDILFDGAVRIFNSFTINEQQAARREMQMIDKQRQLLENLEYQGNMNLTKKQAAEVIKTRLEQKKGV